MAASAGPEVKRGASAAKVRYTITTTLLPPAVASVPYYSLQQPLNISSPRNNDRHQGCWNSVRW